MVFAFSVPRSMERQTSLERALVLTEISSEGRVSLVLFISRICSFLEGLISLSLPLVEDRLISGLRTKPDLERSVVVLFSEAVVGLRLTFLGSCFG
jgi:hypothetical protein